MPGAAQMPVIESATINTSTNQIGITGVNLLPAIGMPAVGLGKRRIDRGERDGRPDYRGTASISV
jgi:hypothetical protein